MQSERYAWNGRIEEDRREREEKRREERRGKRAEVHYCMRNAEHWSKIGKHNDSKKWQDSLPKESCRI